MIKNYRVIIEKARSEVSHAVSHNSINGWCLKPEGLSRKYDGISQFFPDVERQELMFDPRELTGICL